MEANELVDFIKDGLKIKEFKIKELSKKKTSLLVSSIDDYTRVNAYLEKAQTKFFTFTPKSMKIKTYLLKGLSANINPTIIQDELRKFNNENLNVLKVSQFKTKKATTNGYDLLIYLVQISGESKVYELKAIKALFYRCIRWEPLRKSEIPQCRRCHSFLHSASNCFLPPRCVKCNEEHKIAECPQQKVPENEGKNYLAYYTTNTDVQHRTKGARSTRNFNKDFVTKNKGYHRKGQQIKH